jgi:hypothetical protein
MLNSIFFILSLIFIYFLTAQQTFFLNAKYRKAVCSVVTVHVGITAIEVEVTCVSTTYRTKPIVTVATNIVEPTITVVAVTCNSLFNTIF